MREKILECLGNFPVHTDLKLIELESIDKESYVQKLIEYNVEDDERHCPISGIKTIEQNNNNANFKSIIFDGDHSFCDAEKKIVYDFLDKELKKGTN